MAGKIGAIPSGRAASPSDLSRFASSQSGIPIAADLESALHMAALGHRDQVDKGGAPYILHPLRVMLRGRTIEEQIVGVLHDVVEDTLFRLDHIREHFGDGIADAVDCLTKRKGETYSGFILRCAENPLARRVKMYDLADNMDLARLPGEPTADDARRQQKYADARGLLSSFGRLDAQGIETRSATTEGRGPKDESPVAESDAP